MDSSKKLPDGTAKELQQLPNDIDEQRYIEIAEQTMAAIAAQGPSPTVNSTPSAERFLPELPRYQPPPLPLHFDMPPHMLNRTSHAVCRMLFPTSGHLGFGLLEYSEEQPPIETVREMIVYETRLRLSDSIQELMDLYHNDEAAVT
ncbi:unnamed protein product [Didymodactylos carnosus]|uniref:Uncharacterized protein n=1 Tax=Didymodactylos carnosus TaxID=1234261 RepID=A0A815HKI0_9BILA|nr:unnamed protein product [Didymodactylos carnosus]CAF4224547.1 unnamed protein product [Didymodactylos carnosus]